MSQHAYEEELIKTRQGEKVAKKWPSALRGVREIGKYNGRVSLLIRLLLQLRAV